MASMYNNIFCATNCSPGLGPEAVQLCTDQDLALLYGCTWHGLKQAIVQQPLGTKTFVLWEMSQVVRVFGTEKVNPSTLPLGLLLMCNALLASVHRPSAAVPG